MSQPEWMKKYNEIGQKGDEELTADGKTSPVRSKRESVAIEQPGAPSTAPAPGSPAAEKPKGGGFLFGKKEEPKPESDDEDAAALFAAGAGGGAAASSDDDSAAAMFAAGAGGGAAASSDDDSAAAMFAAGAGGGAAASSDDDSAEEEVIEEEEILEEEEVVEESTPAGGDPADKQAISDWRKQRGEEVGEEGTADETPAETEAAPPAEEAAPAEAEETPRDFPASPPVDENDNWVPGKEEENEVVVDDDGNEIEDEVIEVDEHGNEIVEDEVIEDEEVFLDEDGNEIVEDLVEDEIVDDQDGTRELPLGDDEKPDLDAQYELLYKTPEYERSAMSGVIPFLIFAILLAAGLLVAYLAFDVGDDDDAANSPTEAPKTAVLPLGPTNIGVIDVAETTPLDPVQGNCNFDTLTQPHVIDQCACGSTISTIAPDVLTRYEILVPWVSSLFSDWDETASSCSTRNQALVWMSAGLNLGGEISDEHRRDRYVSGYLYIDQGGEGWANSNSWLSGADVCKWVYVFCDQQGSVVGLDLQDNNLEGQLSDAVAMYEFIEFISVRRNQLAGTLPEELFASSTLKSIDLYDNNIFGEIPSFDPSIPLQTLHMGSNNLSGKIYPSIANAKSLARLDLSSNTLNGELPAVLFDLPLEELSLHTNLFSGVIPTDIGKTTSLVKLDVGNNGFGGELPVEMGSLSNLEELMIRNVPQLTGRIPASYGLLFRNLLKIVISETGINGNIPETFGSISNLETIDFSKNFFRGDLPSELGNLVNLKTLDLFDNDISGTIPAEFGNMTALEELLLEDNNISGDIPSQLGRLENLRSLSLQDNSMGGRAPDEVCSLRSEGLDVFVVDCPERDGGDSVLGIICRIPDCCTDCK